METIEYFEAQVSAMRIMAEQLAKNLGNNALAPGIGFAIALLTGVAAMVQADIEKLRRGEKVMGL